MQTPVSEGNQTLSVSGTNYGCNKAAYMVVDACICSHAFLSKARAQAGGMTAAVASCK
jgi:hypothetical protein